MPGAIAPPTVVGSGRIKLQLVLPVAEAFQAEPPSTSQEFEIKNESNDKM